VGRYKTRYGLDFPAEMPDAIIELKCWKHWREPAYGGGTIPDPWDCFWRGIYTLVPEEDFVRHRWAEEHVHDWTAEDFLIIWGAAASGKSNDIGLLALVDWLLDPLQTVAILASTTLGMLKLRSFESVVRYFKKIKRHAPFEMPGRLSKTTTAILLEDGDAEDTSEKASIRGVAVSEGSEEEARAKLQGAHLPYVRLILDELSQMRPAAMSVRTNLAIGATSFKLVGMCNPDSFNDLAGRFSAPVALGGFASLDPDVDTEWRSQYGLIRRHDGLHSPAIVEPDGERRFPFLLTRPVLDEQLRQAGGNWDDPQLWTMVRAWPPTQGKRQTLLSMADVLAYRAMDHVSWRTGHALRVMGVDPAFTSEGNRGAMRVLDVGYDEDLRLKLLLHPLRYVDILASSDVPVLAQVSRQVADYAQEMNVPDWAIGVDDSATQSLADQLQISHMLRVRRFVSNAKASDLPMNASDRQLARDRYADQNTELWAAVAEFVRAGQLRGLDGKTAEQATSRPTEEGRRPLKLVSKKAKAAEGGSGKNSPDEMDATAIACGVLRYHLRIFPGSEKIPLKFVANGSRPPGLGGGMLELARKHDLDSSAYTYAGT